MCENSSTSKSILENYMKRKHSDDDKNVTYVTMNQQVETSLTTTWTVITVIWENILVENGVSDDVTKHIHHDASQVSDSETDQHVDGVFPSDLDDVRNGHTVKLDATVTEFPVALLCNTLKL